MLMGPFNCLSQTGGPYYEVLLGRRDSIMANYTAANTVLPSPTFNVSALSTKFAAVGLSEVDMVTLSGISHSSPHGKSRKNSSGVFKISSTLFSKKRNAHIIYFAKCILIRLQSKITLAEVSRHSQSKTQPRSAMMQLLGCYT